MLLRTLSKYLLKTVRLGEFCSSQTVYFFPYILSLNLPLQMQSLPPETHFNLQIISWVFFVFLMLNFSSQSLSVSSASLPNNFAMPKWVPASKVLLWDLSLGFWCSWAKILTQAESATVSHKSHTSLSNLWREKIFLLKICFLLRTHTA